MCGIIEFKQKHPHVCYYCEKEITEKKNVTVDHMIPQSRGGEREENNLCIACRECNREKAQMTVEEYLQYKVEVSYSCLTIEEKRIIYKKHQYLAGIKMLKYKLQRLGHELQKSEYELQKSEYRL